MLTKDEIEALENWLDSNCHFDAPSPNDKTWGLSADALEKLAAAIDGIAAKEQGK